MQAKLSYSEVKLKMEHWCAYQERCQFEVETKARSFRLPEQEIQQLIAELITTNFIDEERFALAYASGKFNIKRWGKIKIKQHLKAKHVSGYSIQKALDSIDPEEYLNCIGTLILKKEKQLKESESAYHKKAKIHQYLASKGFEFSLVEDEMRAF